MEQMSLFQMFGESGTQYNSLYLQSVQISDQPTLVSLDQQSVINQNPYTYFFKNCQTIEEIEAIEKNQLKIFYKKSNSLEGKRKYSEFSEIVWAVKTKILTEEYRKVDPRFLEVQEGHFLLEDKNGIQTKVGFKFNPDKFGSLKRKYLPTPHLEFRSEEATEISSTGYFSHFLGYIQYYAVESFDDYLIKLLQLQLNIRSVIIYNNQRFEPSTVNDEKKVTKKSLFCEDCEIECFDAEECSECGCLLIDPNEEDLNEN